MLKHEPDFSRLLDVLARRPTAKPVLFEFLIDHSHLQRLAGANWIEHKTPADFLGNLAQGFAAGGYNHCYLYSWAAPVMNFPRADRDQVESVGMAHGGIITTREDFENYAWPDPDADDWSFIDAARPRIPEGMKLITSSAGGLLENLIALMGYEELCIALYEDPSLVADIADAIGSRLYRYYERTLEYDLVGAVTINDDWGFKTQTFLAAEHMRQYIIPWHKKMVDLAHSAGRPAILHSCGCLDCVWEDVIEDIGFEAKHSCEDTILPIEQVYERYGSRIALLGGIDLDFLCRSTPEEITARATAMIERTQSRGGYALGSGNSIPAYVPAAGFDAMREAALGFR